MEYRLVKQFLNDSEHDQTSCIFQIPHKVYNFQNLLTFKRGQDEKLNFKSK